MRQEKERKGQNTDPSSDILLTLLCCCHSVMMLSSYQYLQSEHAKIKGTIMQCWVPCKNTLTGDSIPSPFTCSPPKKSFINRERGDLELTG
jgi:hypothetical protein